MLASYILVFSYLEVFLTGKMPLLLSESMRRLLAINWQFDMLITVAAVKSSGSTA